MRVRVEIIKSKYNDNSRVYLLTFICSYLGNRPITGMANYRWTHYVIIQNKQSICAARRDRQTDVTAVLSNEPANLRINRYPVSWGARVGGLINLLQIVLDHV